MMMQAPIRRTITAEEADKIMNNVGARRVQDNDQTTVYLLTNGQRLYYDKASGVWSLSGIEKGY